MNYLVLELAEKAHEGLCFPALRLAWKLVLVSIAS